MGREEHLLTIQNTAEENAADESVGTFFQWGKLWVSTSVAALTLLTHGVLGLEVCWTATGLVFVAALLIYAVDDLFDDWVERSRDLPQLLAERRGSLVIMTIALVGMIAILIRAPAGVTPLVILGGGTCLLYGAPMFRRRDGGWWRPKHVPGLKAWWVAGAVTLGVVYVPVAFAGTTARLEQLPQLLLFLGVFTYVNVVLFDLRDVSTDRAFGVATLPVLLGSAPTQRLLALLLLLLMAGLGALWVSGLQSFHSEFVLGVLWGLADIAILDESRPRWQFALWVDGSLIGIGVAAWLGSWV